MWPITYSLIIVKALGTGCNLFAEFKVFSIVSIVAMLYTLFLGSIYLV